MDIPIFKISEETLKDIREQIIEDERFSVEVNSNGWALFIDGNADVYHGYEAETGASWNDIEPIEFDSIVLYDNNGEEVAISDEFEVNIMNQVKL